MTIKAPGTYVVILIFIKAFIHTPEENAMEIETWWVFSKADLNTAEFLVPIFLGKYVKTLQKNKHI